MLPKKLSFISSAVLIVFGLIVAVLFFTRHEQIHAAAADKPALPAQNQPAAAPQTQDLPPGTISYTAKAVTTAQFAARGHLT